MIMDQLARPCRDGDKTRKPKKRRENWARNKAKKLRLVVFIFQF